MSALTNAFIRSTTTIGTSDRVNTELVTNISTLDLPAVAVSGATSAEYQIIFTSNGDRTNPARTVWRFDTEAKRNTTLTNIDTLIGNTIASV